MADIRITAAHPHGASVTGGRDDGSRAAYEGPRMADISEYEVVTFQREPGHWRASITPKARAGVKREPAGFVTKEDCDSEVDARNAANEAIKKLAS
jgi:shikimate kinase